MMRGKGTSAGRVPDSQKGEYIPCQRVNVSFPFDLYNQLNSYCEAEERTRSWVIQKAVEDYLKKHGA